MKDICLILSYAAAYLPEKKRDRLQLKESNVENIDVSDWISFFILASVWCRSRARRRRKREKIDRDGWTSETDRRSFPFPFPLFFLRMLFLLRRLSICTISVVSQEGEKKNAKGKKYCPSIPIEGQFDSQMQRMYLQAEGEREGEREKEKKKNCLCCL